jgi:hypothetical protein
MQRNIWKILFRFHPNKAMTKHFIYLFNQRTKCSIYKVKMIWRIYSSYRGIKVIWCSNEQWSVRDRSMYRYVSHIQYITICWYWYLIHDFHRIPLMVFANADLKMKHGEIKRSLKKFGRMYLWHVNFLLLFFVVVMLCSTLLNAKVL